MLCSCLTVLLHSCASVTASAARAACMMHDMVPTAQGAPIPLALANCIIAACGQLGDMPRAWETFEALEKLRLTPSMDTYDALAGGCNGHGHADVVAKLYQEAAAHGLAPTAMTHMHKIKAAVVLQDLPGAMERLEEWMSEQPVSSIPLEAMDAVVYLAERQGDRRALKALVQRLPQPVGSRGKVRARCWCVCVTMCDRRCSGHAFLGGTRCWWGMRMSQHPGQHQGQQHARMARDWVAGSK